MATSTKREVARPPVAGRRAFLVPDTVRGSATRRPDTPALVSPESSVTYRALWLRAGGWSRAVHAHLDPAALDPVVGVLMERGVEVPIASLATWLAGAAYLPLDPQLPTGRIANIVQDSGCAVVITTDELKALLPGETTAITEPAEDWDAGEPACEPQSLAYVIYTSGSTGRPKGVEIEHRNLANLMDWYPRAYGLGPGIRTSMFANLGFDGLVADMWIALSSGATLCIPDRGVPGDMDQMIAFLDRQRIHHSYVPTPMAERLLASVPRIPSLRSLITGGDRLRVWPHRDWPAAVHNHYGPTETTVVVTATGDLRRQDRGQGLPPIGVPIAGAEIRIVSEDGTVHSGPGAEGELIVGGPVVGRGYRGATQRSNGAFVKGGPFGAGRWYRTGDICRWRRDGQLEFVERRDDQVKIRGYRVELGEIEQSLLCRPGIRQAAVTVRSAEAGEMFAWVEGQEGQIDELSTIQALRLDLPDYMIPSRIIVLDRLPMTRNGKVDRADLMRRHGTARPPS